MLFGDWMIAIDGHLEKAVGFTSSDLADCCYYDWWEDGITPRQAAKLALQENF
jgi:hypothetical protein